MNSNEVSIKSVFYREHDTGSSVGIGGGSRVGEKV